jgi:bla regulator protein BlaR1
LDVRLLRIATFVLTCVSATAQPPGWEVLSIKPNHSNSTDSNLDSAPGGRTTATNITVRELIRLAYGVKDYQIEHTPGWVDTDRFDINGKNTSGKNTNLEEERTLIRSLLADRFHLAVRHETRQRPVYLLVVGKDGPKLTPHNDGTGSGTRKGCGQLKGTRLTMDTIATVLSRQLDRDVLNQTGLEGKFDFQLDWTPDAGPCSEDSPVRPSFVTAIQQQLGLKLEAGKGPAEYLIVERIDRPTDN